MLRSAYCGQPIVASVSLSVCCTLRVHYEEQFKCRNPQQKTLGLYCFSMETSLKMEYCADVILRILSTLFVPKLQVRLARKPRRLCYILALIKAALPSYHKQ